MLHRNLLSSTASVGARDKFRPVIAAKPTTFTRPGTKIQQTGGSRVVKQKKSSNPKPKIRFPRLADETPENEAALEADYYDLGAYWSNTTLEIGSYLAAYLRCGLSTQSFVGGPGTSGPTNGIHQGNEDPEEFFFKIKSDYLTELASKFKPNLKIDENTVTASFMPISFDFSFPIGTQYQRQMVAVEKSLRTVFPKFRMPTTYAKDEAATHIARYGLPADGISTGWLSMDQISKIRFTDTPQPNYYLPEKFAPEQMSKDRKKALDALFFSIRLVDLSTNGSHQGVSSMADRGTVSTLSSVTVRGTIEISTQVRFPLEMAMYSTYSRNINEFVPKVFFDWTSTDVLSYVIEGLHGGHMRAMPLRKVREENEKIKQEWGFNPKPRVNAENYAINTHGNVVWIPSVDNPEEYDRILRESYDPKTGDIKPNNKIPELANRPLLTDWFNEVFAYTNSEGRMTTEQMNGYIALNDITIARYVMKPFIEVFGVVDVNNVKYNKKAGDVLNRLLKLGNEVAKKQGIFAKFSGNNPLYMSLRDLYDNICYDVNSKATVGNVLSGDAVNKKGDPLRQQTVESIQVFTRICKAIAEEIPNNRSYATSTFMAARFWFHLLGEYATQDKRFRDAWREGLAKNETVPPDQLPETLELPNLPGLAEFGLLPHQVQTGAQSDKHPENLVLDIQPGGGKCLVGSSLVLTDNGLLSLKEIWNKSKHPKIDGFKKTEVEILNRSGIQTATKVYRTRGKTFKVTLSDGSTVEGLKQHRMWARLPGGTFDYVRLNKLTNTHILQKYIGSNLYGSEKDLADYCPEEIEGEVRIPSVMSRNLATLLGLLVAEGCFNYGVTFTNHSLQILRFYSKLYKRLFHCTPLDGNNPDFDYRCHPTVARFIENLVGGKPYSDQQTVPLCIRQAPRKYQIAFLKGLFEGDGSIYHGSKGKEVSRVWIFEYCTISKQLAEHVKCMLENIGIPCSTRSKEKYESKLGTGRTEGKLHQAHQIYIEYRYLDLLRAEIGFISNNKRVLLDTAVKHLAFLRKDAQQNTNITACGTFNRWPIAEDCSDILQDIEEIASRITYDVSTNSNGSGGRTEFYSLAKLWRDVGHGNNATRGNKNPFLDKTDTNLYSVKKLLTLYDNLPSEIKSKVSAKCGRRLEELRFITKHVWVYPVKLELV